MRTLRDSHVEWLDEVFDERVNYARRERSMYSHDVGALPGMIRPLVGSTMPAAVVQPVCEEELQSLVRWASERRVPLVPRGKATSGYGGVLPVQGGVVVDFVRMQRVLSVDRETVTVQPGLSWQKLDRALAGHGLTLRLYPSSYPSSTVGGWLAQGGAGFGSWKYGWFAENVLAARVVLGDGAVRELSGGELEMVSEAEGITGLITAVTLKVMPAGEVAVSLSAFDDAEAAVRFVVSLREVEAWSVSFVNPEMVRLAAAAPLRTHHGRPVEERPGYPERYLVQAAWQAGASGGNGSGSAGGIRARIEALARSAGGEALPEELARHEWEERFHIMKVKRLGPSLVPAEVVVPLEGLPGLLSELERKVRQPLVLEGMGVSGREMVLLGFIPHDERRFSYNLAFALYLTVASLARKHGGRVYSTGLYFAREAPALLGRQRLQELKGFKARHDPAGVLNPGKVLSSRLSAVMGIASAFEPLIRPFANAAGTRLGERIGPRAVKGIPPEVAWYAYACSSCGFCLDECAQFYGRLWESQSPRGKWFLLRQILEGRDRLDQEAVNTFMVCTTCEMCNVTCSEGLPVEPSWLRMRQKSVEEKGMMTIPPFEIMSASLEDNLNIWAYYRQNRADWVPEDVKPVIRERADTLYFAGCTASFVENDIGQSAVRLLKDAGMEFAIMGEDECCCGLPMLVAGKWQQFGEIVRHNLAEAEKRGASRIITSCPACWLSWKHFYKEWAEKLGIPYAVEVQHYSQALQPAVQNGTLEFRRTEGKVTWHDSCHIGRAGGVYEPPRELIRAVPGVELRELEHNRQHGHCCGSVLSLISEPEVAYRIGKMKLQEAQATGADEILALCPCCEFQMRVSADRTGTRIKVTDLAAFLARARGYEVKEDLGHVLDSWATFEAMIALMQPENMAALMQELFPELLRAMPAGMGGMMRFMGRLGPVGAGLLRAMKPLFPVLFPILMPGMMPKVMPAMLEAVGRRVPMPDFMREQMPTLMPRAMGNLLPHMLPAVVPLIAQPLVDHLLGRAGPGPGDGAPPEGGNGTGREAGRRRAAHREAVES